MLNIMITVKKLLFPPPPSPFSLGNKCSVAVYFVCTSGTAKESKLARLPVIITSHNSNLS